MKPLARRIVEQTAKKLGYVVLPKWRAESYTQSCWYQRMLEQLDIDCVIDVGANAGQFARMIRHEIEFSGPIVSVEPIPYLAEDLAKQALNDPLWQIEGCALGEKQGVLTLHVMARDQFSSLRLPDETYTSEFAGLNVPTSSVEVTVKTLDALLTDLRTNGGFRRPYLKLDTQGFDFEVLKGATSVLDSVVALQTEASIIPIYKDAPRYTEVISWLESRGFVLSGMFPNNPHQFPKLVEFDCHMVNTRLAKK